MFLMMQNSVESKSCVSFDYGVSSMVGQKKFDFCQKATKPNIVVFILWHVPKKCQNLTIKVNFQCKDSFQYFWKSFSLQINKGQLISKGLLVSSIFPKNKKRYYDTSGRIVFVRFLEELRIPKSPFEIYWPLV